MATDRIARDACRAFSRSPCWRSRPDAAEAATGVPPARRRPPAVLRERRSARPARPGEAQGADRAPRLEQDLLARLRDELRLVHGRTRPGIRAEDQRVARRAHPGWLLRRHALPSRRARLRDPGRRSDRSRAAETRATRPSTSPRPTRPTRRGPSRWRRASTEPRRNERKPVLRRDRRRCRLAARVRHRRQGDRRHGHGRADRRPSESETVLRHSPWSSSTSRSTRADACRRRRARSRCGDSVRLAEAAAPPADCSGASGRRTGRRDRGRRRSARCRSRRLDTCASARPDRALRRVGERPRRVSSMRPRSPGRRRGPGSRRARRRSRPRAREH